MNDSIKSEVCTAFISRENRRHGTQEMKGQTQMDGCNT